MIPFKYWRKICPADIPYTKPLTYWFLYTSGKRDVDKYWRKETILPIRDLTASYKECSRRLKRFTNLINKEDHIIQTFPKYKKGIYSSTLKIMSIHPENVQFNFSKGTYKLSEPIYYILEDKEVQFVTESNLITIMENKEDIQYRKAILKLDDIKDSKSTLNVEIVYKNDSTIEKNIQEIINIFGFDFNSISGEETLSFDVRTLRNEKNRWYIYESLPISEEEYMEINQNSKVKCVNTEYCSFIMAMSYSSLLNRLKTKVNVANKTKNSIKDGYDEKFIEFIKSNKSFLNELNISQEEKTSSEHAPLEITEGVTIYNHYKHKKKKKVSIPIITQKKGSFNIPKKDQLIGYVVMAKTIKDKFIFNKSRKQLEEIARKNQGLIILTYKEYTEVLNKKHTEKKANPITFKVGNYKKFSTTTYEGSLPFPRKIRRWKDSKHEGKVKSHSVYVPLKDNKVGETGQRHNPTGIPNLVNDKFITSSTIKGSMEMIPKKERKLYEKVEGNRILKNGEHSMKFPTTREKTFSKVIYTRISGKNNSDVITHNMLKTENRKPKKLPEKIVKLRETYNKQALHQETLSSLIEQFKSHDRRYTVCSKTEKWSTDFFIVLGMIKKRERTKKVVSFLKKCGYSDEFIPGFIRYLQLTRNGIPRRKHNVCPYRRTERIIKTEPCVTYNVPRKWEPIVIERNILNNEKGIMESVITENIYMKNDHMLYDKNTLICKLGEISKWAYVSEYKDPDWNETKWKLPAISGEKKVVKIIRRKLQLEQKVKGKPKKWKAPITDARTDKFVNHLADVYYNSPQGEEKVFSMIKKTIMPAQSIGHAFYDDVRKSLCHKYIGLAKSLAKRILETQKDDKLLTIFAEDLLVLPV